MFRLFAAASLAISLLAPVGAIAQDAKAPAAKAVAAAPKIGKDQKVCRHKFPDGKPTTWVCDKAQPCCAWDAIRYTKCGSTITGCL